MSEAKDDQGATAKHGKDWLTPREYARLTPRQRRKLQAQREGARREKYAAATAEGVAADYRAALAAMPAEGGRHAYVAKVVRVKAKRAAKVLGLDVETFIADCQNAPNGDGLTDRELRSIWNWGHGAGEVQPVDADGVTLPDDDRPKREPSKPKPWECPPTDAERGYVRGEIARGAAWLTWERGRGGGENLKASRLLADVTRGTYPKDGAGMASVLVLTLSDVAEQLGVEGGGKWYAGDKYGAKNPANVRTAVDWASAWLGDGKTDGEAVPPQLSLNPHTGEGVAKRNEDGQPYMSYRNGETVARWLFALVEFDEMPLEDQALFWLGVLADGSLDVVAIVFTANKSIHGVIVVPPTGAGEIGTEANYRAAWGKATRRESGEGWDVKTWGPLSRLVLSSNDGIEHADFSSGSNAAGLFRLAGHMRTEKVERPTLQRLLWLDAPSAREDVETPCEIEAEAVPPSIPVANAEAVPSVETPTAEKPEGAVTGRRCADCPAATVAACRHAYGALWLEKSKNGEGCANAVAVDRMAAAWYATGWPKCAEPKNPKLSPKVEKVLAAIADRKSSSYDWDYVRRFVELTGVVPVWLARECGV